MSFTLRDDRQKRAAFLDSTGTVLTILERLPITTADYQSTADMSHEHQNGVYKWGVLDGHTKVTVIEPCDRQHITKYSDCAEGKMTVVETPHLYATVTGPWMEGQGRAEWVENIVAGGAEREKVVFADQQVVLLPDYKWRTDKLDDFYLLCLFKDEHLRSLRDLRDVTLLVQVKSKIGEVIKSKYNITLQDVSIYFHYPPTYHRLHLHIVSNKCVEFNSSHVNLAHSLDTVIFNLSMLSGYYQKADLPCLVGPTHPLHAILRS